MYDLRNRKIDYLRVSVTDLCNLRCVYCMPKQGILSIPHNEVLTFEEILRICDCVSHLGINKIKLTGGEPLIRPGFVSLVHDVKRLPLIDQVTLTTNGILLYDMLEELVAAGLDAVNISLDTLDSETFYKITGDNELNQVLMAINKAIDMNLKIKINVLPVKELNGDNFVEVATLAKEFPVDIRFIELMPLGCGRNLTPIYIDEIKQKLQQTYGPLIPFEGKLGNGPAKYYSLQGFKGKIGFISAISHEFCAACNRVRLTSTGFLKLCLNYDTGIDLKGPMRSGINDEQLTKLIHDAILNKPEHHNFLGTTAENVEKKGMSQIGG